MIGVTRIKKDFVVGIKQTIKSLKANNVSKCYIAKDADYEKVSIIIDTCQKADITIEYIDTMKDLGEMFSINIGAASVAILKNFN